MREIQVVPELVTNNINWPSDKAKQPLQWEKETLRILRKYRGGRLDERLLNQLNA